MIGLHLTHPAEWDAIPAEVTALRLWDCGVHWGAIHTAPGVYDWAPLDRLVAKAGDRHLTYVIAGTPRWLAKHPDQPHFAPWLGPGSNSMPHSMSEAEAFVTALASRYRGRIKAYEVGNEPQLADFLFPYTDAECNTLAEMTKRFKAAIDRADPDALVLAASVLPRTSSGGMGKASRYLRALKRKGWPVDGFTCHLYPEVGSGGPRWKAMLKAVRATLTELGAPKRPLWVTETAFGLLGPKVTDPARIERMYSVVRDSGVRVYHYAWDRPDLGGPLIAAGTPAWASITKGAGHD
jgi:GH35 family endo-1,4-beta-xylanase